MGLCGFLDTFISRHAASQAGEYYVHSMMAAAAVAYLASLLHSEAKAAAAVV